MKKMIVLAILCLFVMNCISCRDSSEFTHTLELSDMLSRIYEVESNTYGDSSNHAHSITVRDDILYSTESNISVTKKLSIMGDWYDLKYKNTLYYPIGERNVRQYEIHSEQGGSV